MRNKILELEPLDYVEVNFDFESKYEFPYEMVMGTKATYAELMKIQKLRSMLKNAVSHFLLQQRKKPRTISLQEVLNRTREEQR